MQRNILFLSERDFLTVPLLRSLDKNAYRIFVMGPGVSAARFSRFCARYFPYPKHDKSDKDDRFVQYINEMSERHMIDAVIPLDIDSTLWMARNRHRLTAPSLPMSEGSTLSRVHDKWEMTKMLDTLAIPYPKTVLVSGKEGLVSGLMKYPFMIKPTDREAGQGIERMCSDKDLVEYRETRSFYHDRFPVLVQEYVDGPGVDMSLFAIDGKIISWTVQKWAANGLLEFVEDPQIYTFGEKIVAYERYSGFMHIDLQRDRQSGKAFVLECNPRAWGSMNASILAGVDFIGDAVRSVLHEPVGSRLVSKESYATFRHSCMTLLTRPWAFPDISVMSRQDFFRACIDPLPYIFLAFMLLKSCLFGKNV